MPKLSTRPPKYSHHKASGQATVKFNGRVRYLGPYGSQESKTRYQEAIAEWGRQQEQTPTLAAAMTTGSLPTQIISVSELIWKYYRHAIRYYRDKSGESTGTAERLKPVLRLLRETFGSIPVLDFGPLALQRLQELMIERDWSRTYANMNTARIKRMFKWGTAQEIVPAGIMQRLDAVGGLKQGRTDARETDPVEPVADDVVDATLPHLPPVVADMVRFQRLAGCRPTETCILRPCDIDRSSDVWRYVPDSHKTEYRGRGRVVFIGPRAQEILTPYLLRESTAYCFSPKDSERKRLDARHQERKTPLSYGNRPGTNRKRKPRRTAGERYNKDTYCRAIHRACGKAFPPPAPLARRKGETIKQWRERLTEKQRKELKAWQTEHRWSPKQLRHTAGTEIRRQFGLEAAQVILGHSRADVTQVYAERDLAKAADIARQVG